MVTKDRAAVTGSAWSTTTHREDEDKDRKSTGLHHGICEKTRGHLKRVNDISIYTFVYQAAR